MNVSSMRMQTPLVMQHWWLQAAGILQIQEAQNAHLEQVVSLELVVVVVTILIRTSLCRGLSMKMAIVEMNMGMPIGLEIWLWFIKSLCLHCGMSKRNGKEDLRTENSIGKAR